MGQPKQGRCQCAVSGSPWDGEPSRGALTSSVSRPFGSRKARPLLPRTDSLDGEGGPHGLAQPPVDSGPDEEGTIAGAFVGGAAGRAPGRGGARHGGCRRARRRRGPDRPSLPGAAEALRLPLVLRKAVPRRDSAATGAATRRRRARSTASPPAGCSPCKRSPRLGRLSTRPFSNCSSSAMTPRQPASSALPPRAVRRIRRPPRRHESCASDLGA